MDIIGTKVHGIMDYIVGLLLITGPWLLGFINEGAATSFSGWII
jgi:hypothetical protein